MWYQDDISMLEYSLFGSFQFGATGRNKLNYFNIIKEKQWIETGKIRKT